MSELTARSSLLTTGAGYLLLALSFCCCILLYMEGLSGPLVLDDAPNLEDVTRFLQGDKTAWAVITDNRSGPLGRPLSMASFIADAVAWGDSTWHAKRTNLGIHLVIGALVFVFFRLVLSEARCSRNLVLIGSIFAASIWLLHPINVSTVLYLVQRMAQFSALFMVLGLVVFVLARQRIQDGQMSGHWLLWVGVPLMTLAAVLSKENGILLPFLAYGLELTLFRREDINTNRSVRFFFIGMLWIPLAIGLFWIAISPDRFFGGYVLRDFDLGDRLLTQARVLWSYFFAFVLPQNDIYGVFQDDYEVSRGLFEPLTTLISLLSWIGLILLSWAMRYRIPLLAAGLWLFLGGHLVESTILPLEMYFEHRNYFCALGILLALIGLVEFTYKKFALSPSFKGIAISFLVGGIGILCLFTANQIHTWKSEDNFYSESFRLKSDSFRLHSYLLGRAITSGRFSLAEFHIEEADRLLSPRDLPVIPLWRLLAYCSTGENPPGEVYDDLEARIVNGMTIKDMIAWELVAQRFEAGDCEFLDTDKISTQIERWLTFEHIPNTYIHFWKTRYMLARFLAASGRLEEALNQAELSWRDSSYNRGIGILVFQLNASLGRIDRCESILQHLESAAGGGDLAFDRAVARFRAAIESGELIDSTSTDELGSLNPK